MNGIGTNSGFIPYLTDNSIICTRAKEEGGGTHQQTEPDI